MIFRRKGRGQGLAGTSGLQSGASRRAIWSRLADWITGDQEPGGEAHTYIPIEIKAESLVLPVLLLAAAVFVEVLTRSIALYEQRQRLNEMLAAQQARYDTALQLQRQLEGIAAGTARLARGGNANAIQVIKRLRTVGVTVNPDAYKPDADQR